MVFAQGPEKISMEVLFCIFCHFFLDFIVGENELFFPHKNQHTATSIHISWHNIKIFGFFLL